MAENARMSTGRTLVSWTQKARAFIGFGFTIFEFLERLSIPRGLQRVLMANKLQRETKDSFEGTATAKMNFSWLKTRMILAVTVVAILIVIFAFGVALLRAP